MKFKKSLIIGALFVMTLMLSFALAGCDWFNNNNNNNNNNGGDDEEPGAGFTEYPLGDDVEFGAWGINVAGVYFEPVDMTPATSPSASEADAHMEADISALQGNRLGFGAGDFVPGLLVSYEIYDYHVEMGHTIGEARTGNFMLMNASDGPHYGGNVIFGATKGQQGTYKIRFIITVDPAYQVHTDPTTGVDGRFWTTPLVAEWIFDFVPFTA